MKVTITVEQFGNGISIKDAELCNEVEFNIEY